MEGRLNQSSELMLCSDWLNRVKRHGFNYTLPPWPKRKLARLRKIERDFHVRAFGDEMARVNLDMTKEERIDYIGWMRSYARSKGVPQRPSYSVAWLLKVEEELERELKANQSKP